jgi:SWI/SNF-related matrix-associated actin-dependent regulator 1 of chromatin subfamily A
MMTGTPILNKPIELYPILRSLFPERMGAFTDYYRYAFRFCAAFKDVFGFNVDGASNLTELSQILGPVMLRRMKEEVLEQLPEIVYEKIYLDPSDKLNGLVNKEQKAEVTEAGSIRQAIGLLKIKPAITHLEDILTVKNKVVAFTWHKAVAQGLKDHFKERAVLFTGEESTDAKEKAKEDFITKSTVEVFIGQLEAAGVGIDGLQHVCDTCVFVEMYSVPGKIKQAVDRLRRIGQERGVLAQFLIAENSVDEKTVDSLVEKSSNIKTILQEKGETQFVKCRCAICRRPKEVSELKRVDDQSICKTCEILSEVL